MKLESLKDLYLEHHLLDAIPRMAGAASAPDLKKALRATGS